MVIRPPDIHEDMNRAFVAFGMACKSLGITKLKSMWWVEFGVNERDRKEFLELCKKFIKKGLA
jgi:hypothetical protein